MDEIAKNRYSAMVYYVILFVMLSSLLLRGDGESSNITIEQAIRCLKTTKSDPMCAVAFALSPNAVNKDIIAQGKLYQEQMNAINVLISNKSVDNLKYLIPFLGYVSDPGVLMESDTYQMTLDDSKNEFPVFATMLNTPEAGSILESYCLDARNPDDYRMTAFYALKFVDPSRFKAISQTFNEQWDKNDPRVEKILNSIATRSYAFGGMVRVPSSK